MAEIVTKGQRVVPQRALELGYAFAHPDLDEALRVGAQLAQLALRRAVGGVARPIAALARAVGVQLPRARARAGPAASYVGGITSQMTDPDDREQQAGRQARLLAVALARRTATSRRSPRQPDVSSYSALAPMSARTVMCPGRPSGPRGSSRSAADVVGQRDRAGLQHVAALGDVEREVRVLLDEQDRRALLVDLARSSRRCARRGSARCPSRARRAAAASGRAISARPMASICCSPPDIVPAFWFSRSLQAREQLEHALEVLCDLRCRGAGRRPARGSRARSCAGSTGGPRATGEMPSADDLLRRQRSRSSSPSKRIVPVARRREAGDRAQRRRLAGPVGADQRDDLALLDLSETPLSAWMLP